jgi:hypothetical protein
MPLLSMPAALEMSFRQLVDRKSRELDRLGVDTSAMSPQQILRRAREERLRFATVNSIGRVRKRTTLAP